MFCYAVNEKNLDKKFSFIICLLKFKELHFCFVLCLFIVTTALYLKKADFDLTVVFDLNDQDEDICHVKVFRLNGLSSLFSILRTSAYNLLGFRTNYKHVCDTSSVYFFLKAIFASPI